jgi:hypothetical protein
MSISSTPVFKQLPTVRPSTETGVPVSIRSLDDLVQHLVWDTESDDWCTYFQSHFVHSQSEFNSVNPFRSNQPVVSVTLYRLRPGKFRRPTVYRCSVPLEALRLAFVAMSNCSPPPIKQCDGVIEWTPEQLRIMEAVRSFNDGYCRDYVDRQNRRRGERLSTKTTGTGEHFSVHSSTNGTANHGQGGKMFNPESERDGRASTGYQLPDQILSGDDIEDVCQRSFLMNMCPAYCHYFDPTDRGEAYMVARTVERLSTEPEEVYMDEVGRNAGDQISTVWNRKYWMLRFRCLESGVLFSVRSKNRSSLVKNVYEMTSIEGPLEHAVTFRESEGMFGSYTVQNDTWIKVGRSSRAMEVVYGRALRNLKFITRTLYSMLNRQSTRKNVDLYENTVRRTRDEFGKLNRFPLFEMMQKMEWTDDQRALADSQLEHVDSLAEMFPHVDSSNRRLFMYNEFREENGHKRIGLKKYYERLNMLYKRLAKVAEDMPFIDEPTVFEYSGQIASSHRAGGLNSDD